MTQVEMTLKYILVYNKCLAHVSVHFNRISKANEVIMKYQDVLKSLSTL